MYMQNPLCKRDIKIAKETDTNMNPNKQSHKRNDAVNAPETVDMT